MPGRTTTKDEPTPAEEVQPTAPAPAAPAGPPTPEPEPEDRTREYGAGDGPVDLRGRTRRNLLGQEVTWPLSVGEAITEVTARIGAIPKSGRATGQGGGYAFRGIDQALAALHPLLGEVGLVILPGKVVREQFETRATASGGTLNVARLLVRYRFIGPDGSELRGEAWGEAGDSGDKATQKAHSQSYKSLVFQTFSIPTEESAEDEPDRTNEPSRPWTEDEVQRATAARDAATAADTVEKLAGVRRRALHLLRVPVQTYDGGLAPLSVLFDAKLAVLDRAAADGPQS